MQVAVGQRAGEGLIETSKLIVLGPHHQVDGAAKVGQAGAPVRHAGQAQLGEGVGQRVGPVPLANPLLRFLHKVGQVALRFEQRQGLPTSDEGRDPVRVERSGQLGVLLGPGRAQVGALKPGMTSDRDEALNPLGVQAGEPEGEPGPQRVAQDRHRPQGGQHCGQVVHRGLKTQSRVGLGEVCVAGQGDGQGGNPAREVRQERVEALWGPREAVQEHPGGAFALASQHLVSPYDADPHMAEMRGGPRFGKARGSRLSEQGPPCHAGTMRKTESAILLSMGLMLAGCPKGAEPAHGDSASPKAQPSGQASASNDAQRLAPDTVVATWKDGKLTYGELLEKKKSTFEALERKQLKERFDAETQELETLLVEQLVEKVAKTKNQTPEEYFKTLAEGKEVADADIEKFYNENVKPRPGSPPLEQIKDRIKGFLVQQQGQELVKTEIDRLKAEANMKIDLPTPEAMKVKFDLAGRPMKGNPQAKITLVEFSDFECPYCSRATEPVEAILKAYPNDVKVYFLHFPLNFHQKAMPAAIAAQCANEQDKFWDFHDKVFANQSTLADDKHVGWAKEIGLDVTKFEACQKNEATAKFVQDDMKQGEMAGVRGTPSFYINGEPYAQGVPTVEALKPYL